MKSGLHVHYETWESNLSVCFCLLCPETNRVVFFKELNTRPEGKEVFQCYLRKLITTLMAEDNRFSISCHSYQ